MENTNLEIYNKSRDVPKEAQKTITGGRLNGMTNINPMWRIRKLTELFGTAGIGWYFSEPTFIEKKAESGEVMVHCSTALFIKVGNEWSSPIQGVGGSFFVKKESNRLYTDDEAYKKAYTDAQSVACKALGIGADIYWNNDPTKYDTWSENSKQEQNDTKSVSEPVTSGKIKNNAQSAKPAQNGSKPPVCTVCGQPVTGVGNKDGILIHSAEEIVEYSKNSYGKVLCWNCIKNANGGK